MSDDDYHAASKSLPHLTDEELDALLVAVGKMVRECEFSIDAVRPELRGKVQHNHTLYLSLRAMLSEVRFTPVDPAP